MGHWAGLSFQLTLCVPEQAQGVLTGLQLAPVLGLSEGWPKSQRTCIFKKLGFKAFAVGLVLTLSPQFPLLLLAWFALILPYSFTLTPGLWLWTPVLCFLPT